MKKLVGLLLFLVIVLLTSTYYVGKITEQKTHELIAEYSSDDVQIEIVDYDRHFFSASVTTQVSFNDETLSGSGVQVRSEITHYPYKAVSINHLSFLDDTLNDKFNRYFSTDAWFVSKEEFTLWGNLKGTLLLPAGHYEGNDEVLSSESININYDIDFKQNKGTVNGDWNGIVIKTKSENLQLENLVISSTFSNDSTLSKAWQYTYDMKIDKLTQRSAMSGEIASLFESVLLTGGSKSSDNQERVNTNNSLKIKRYQLGKDEELQFLNNEFVINMDDLYQPALDSINESAVFSEQTSNSLAELVRHGFNFSIPRLHSETPWGDIDGKFDFLLNEGAVLPDVLNNPYLLLDHGEGSLNLSLPQVFLNFPNIGDILAPLLQSGLLIIEDKKLILDGTYNSGELMINNEFIPL